MPMRDNFGNKYISEYDLALMKGKCQKVDLVSVQQKALMLCVDMSERTF